MPRMFIDTSYRKGDDSQEHRNKIRKLEREKARKLYPSAKNFTQKIITHGIPNRNGEVKPDFVVVRTEFDNEDLS